jgi:hypothetical protein
MASIVMFYVIVINKINVIKLIGNLWIDFEYFFQQSMSSDVYLSLMNNIYGLTNMFME